MSEQVRAEGPQPWLKRVWGSDLISLRVWTLFRNHSVQGLVMVVEGEAGHIWLGCASDLSPPAGRPRGSSPDSLHPSAVILSLPGPSGGPLRSPPSSPPGPPRKGSLPPAPKSPPRPLGRPAPPPGWVGGLGCGRPCVGQGPSARSLPLRPCV